MDNVKIFDALLANELNQEEISAFNGRLDSDPMFKQEYLEYKTLVQGIRYSHLLEKRQMLQQLEESISGKPEQSLSLVTPKYNIRKILYWAAACLVLGFAWTFLDNQQYNKNQTAMQQFIIDNYGTQWIKHRKMRSSNTASNVDSAYDFYTLEDFNSAIPLLKDAVESKKDSFALFYLGISYFKTGDFEKAKTILEDKNMIAFINSNDFGH